jgi:hypothetical protein
VNPRIESLIDMGRLVREPASDEEVRGLWASALEAYDDACLAARAANRRITAAYDAGRVAALAVVRSADLRVRAQNHHEVTLATAGLLAGDPLQGLLQEFQALRLERIQIEYGWTHRASADDVEKAVTKAREILGRASETIAALRPALEALSVPEA